MKVQGARLLHTALAVAWGVVLGAAVIEPLGLFYKGTVLLGVAFVSICSIYANMVGHWAGREGAKADEDSLTPEEFRAFVAEWREAQKHPAVRARGTRPRLEDYPTYDAWRVAWQEWTRKEARDQAR